MGFSGRGSSPLLRKDTSFSGYSVRLLDQSPLLLDKKRLHLLPWSPGMNNIEWPSVAPVWIRLKRVPYHCWSQHILFSIARSLGSPLRLDTTTATQRILSYARILVNLDLSKPRPPNMLVDLEGEGEVELEIIYENLPCYICLSSGHPFSECPSSISGKEKSASGTAPSRSSMLDQVNQVPTGSISVAPGSLPTNHFPSNALAAISSASPDQTSTNPSTPVISAHSALILSKPTSSINPSGEDITCTHSQQDLTTQVSNPHQDQPEDLHFPKDNHLYMLPKDLSTTILEKIPTSPVDLSNPFEVLHLCSFKEPTDAVRHNTLLECQADHSKDGSSTALAQCSSQVDASSSTGHVKTLQGSLAPSSNPLLQNSTSDKKSIQASTLDTSNSFPILDYQS